MVEKNTQFMSRSKLQTTPLKNFAQKELAKSYPMLQKLVSEMPELIDASEYVGWVGAILKLVSLCDASREGNKVGG